MRRTELNLNPQRYKRSGGSKRCRLGISAPLPVDFIKVCSDLGIPVDPGDVKGGLSVDGERVELDNEDIDALDGRWLI
jgi:hypothetical protein